MYNYCCASTKMLLLVALLVLPSVFAYGNRPDDYTKNSQASGGKTPYTTVNYWSKLMPYQLNQGRSPSGAQCFNPSTSSGLFTDCRPFESQAFPAGQALCRCSKCNQVSFKLLCFEGTWYLHPDVYDFPCDNCGTTCNIQSARNFNCEDKSTGTMGNVRSCTCVEDCREYDVECTSKGNWVQKATFDSIQNKIECSSQPKTVYSQDKDMEYRNGLISVRCKDGFQTQGQSVVACRNGQLNATVPQCIPTQNPGFGGGFGGGNGDIDQQEYPDYNVPIEVDPESVNGDPNFPTTDKENPYKVVGKPTPAWTNPDYTLLHIPSTKGPARGPNSDALSGRPTSSSVTSTKRKGQDDVYLYVLYAVIAVIALVAVAALVFYCYKHHQPTKGSVESGVASGDQQPTSSTHGSYATKK